MCTHQIATGKRSCLGELLARQELFLFFAGLLQQFDVRPPEGQDRIDEKENLFMTLAPSPFQVRLIPRRGKIAADTDFDD